MAANRRNPIIAGDTIVEVLIAMAVAATVLALSFSTMSRNLYSLQDAQERSTAVKLIQGQIEAVRNLYNAKDATFNGLSTNTSFCVYNNGQSISTGFQNTAPSGLDLTSDSWGNYPANCTQGPGNIYHLGISTADKSIYKFYARWDQVGARSRDQVMMVYKVD